MDQCANSVIGLFSMKIILKIIIWMVVIFVIIFTGFAILGFWHKAQIKKTAEAIERINSRKITLEDVMGENLPLKPDQELNDSTIAGIDANKNTIRDDVELAIFEKYPNSAKIRAAELQYAQALQLELTEVFNSETLIATIQKESFAYSCLGEANNNELRNNEEFIENLIMNTDLREKAIDDAFKYMTTYALLNRENCDVNLLSLPN